MYEGTRMSNTAHTLLLVIGVLWIAKSAWALLWPRTFQTVSRHWLKATSKLNTLLGIVVIAIAIAMWAVVLIDQPIAYWILVVLGAGYAATAIAMFNGVNYQRFVESCILNRSPFFLRVLGLISLLLGLFVTWVAISNK
tara:strand:+ start:47 stop:463 length:417 start_codon:yes stop_codon:yes gene_type:complete